MSTLSELKTLSKLYQQRELLKKILKFYIAFLNAMKKNLNLNSIKYLQDLKLPVSFSDHSLGDHASLVAIGLGSRVMKNILLNKNLKGPDHKSSLNPKELISFIKD